MEFLTFIGTYTLSCSKRNSPGKRDRNEQQKRQLSRFNCERKVFYMLDKYGDLEVFVGTESESLEEQSKGYKPANFYTVDGALMLGLPIGHEITANSKVEGEDNASPSSCSHVAGDNESGSVVISTTPYYSDRIKRLLEDQRSKYFTALMEFDIKDPKSTWTQLDPQTNDSDEVKSGDVDNTDDCSDDGVGASNKVEFGTLKEHPEWGQFFNQYSDLKPGNELGQGGQAKVYEATGTVAVDDRHLKGRYVGIAVKVFAKGFRLRDLQRWWPNGLVEAAHSQLNFISVPYVCWAIGAQLLEDNRFAFVFPKLNCDLRKRIDAAMLKQNGAGPPFSPFTCFCIISDIAAGMAYLHNRELLHHDLKAANVLDLRNVCEDQTCIMMLVADFESSVGIAGTKFWRAPEILSQVRARKEGKGSSEPFAFSKKADVYSFAMTCYEVITGLDPFEDRSPADFNGIIDCDERPEWPPLDICPELKDLVCRCWSSDPLQRPSFDTIRTELIELGQKQSKAWNVNLRYKTLDFYDKRREKTNTKEAKTMENDHWEWPIYDQYRSRRGVERLIRYKTIDDVDLEEDKAPFEVTSEQDDKTMPNTVTVKLLSPHLIKMAKQCLPQHEQFSIEKPKIDARDMFNALQSFRDAHQSIQQDDDASESQKWHSKHLLRFLETHFKDTTAQVERMRREKKVSFHLLWAFVYKGEKVCYKCRMTDQTLQGIVVSAHYNNGCDGKMFKGKIEYRVYNGSTYLNGSRAFAFPEFKGEYSFEFEGGREFCPMRLLEPSQVAEMEAMFLRNGRKFYSIVAQGRAYMQYEGPLIKREKVEGGYLFKKQKADGRVMVDLLSFARTNPDYPLYSEERPTNRNAQTVACGDQEMPSDEHLMLAPAAVYGFSFSNKQWGGFDIHGLSKINFHDQAFDRDLLLTDPDTKEMLLALVTQYLKDPSAGDNPVPKIDPISDKGDGCIFLCYGPPGTGKTLTAESIAEKLHRPLWSVSVFELGVTAKELETNLMEILEIASQWRAVLLLDEADLYLEKRTPNADSNRIAMTAIFLRLLEYYRGVLFLTSNRVASFDDAFCSRISMFLRFRRLGCEQREAVWRNLLSRAQIQNPDLTLFRDFQLNGREIRNCIRIAQTLARSSGEELTTNHVLRVVKMPVELRRNLEVAIMEETKERSISTRVIV